MKKNVASQSIGAQMVTAADGTAFTGTVSVLVTIDNGTQTAGGGTAPAHEGNGYHSYTPTQAETNGDHIAFTFTGTGAIPATVQVYTTFPQTGDSFARLGEPAGASVSADVAAVKVDTAAVLVDTGTSGVLLADTATSAQLVDDVWDEALTGATHNVNTSSGKRLRQVTSTIIRSELAQGPGTGTNQIQLDTGASAVDGAYDPSLIYIISGTGLGQCRLVLQYDGATKTATVDRDWKVNPDATSEYIIIGNPGREGVNEGLAQAGTSSSITLNVLGSAIDDAYVGQIVFIRSGTGADQAKVVTAYNGTTKIATVDGAWGITPDTTSAYVMTPNSPVMLDSATKASINAIQLDTGTTLPAQITAGVDIVKINGVTIVGDGSGTPFNV